jgi:hypothetical protein
MMSVGRAFEYSNTRARWESHAQEVILQTHGFERFGRRVEAPETNRDRLGLAAGVVCVEFS